MIIVVAGLKAASDILVPMAVAAFVAIICLPAIVFLQRTPVPVVGVGLLRRIGVPVSWMPGGPSVQLGAPIAVLLVVLGLLGAFVGTGALVGTSIADFQSTIQEYRDGTRDLSAGAQRVKGWIDRFPELVNSGSDAHRTPAEEPADAEPGTVGPGPSTDGAGPGEGMFGTKMSLAPDMILEFALSLVAGTGALLSSSFLVLMVAALLLLEAAGLPGKLRQAFGGPAADLREATAIIGKIQRYLWIKTVVSAVTGVLLGGVCWLCDVEFPVLWGVVAFALNYVPNIGSIIAMIPPALLAFAQNGVASAAWVVAGYSVVNVVIGNLVEPMLMGKQLGLSPLVVFLSMVFWGWTWGVVGMFLSVPLTMSVKIFFENTKDLHWLAVLMAGAPGSGPPGETAAGGPEKSTEPMEPKRVEARPEPAEPEEAAAPPAEKSAGPGRERAGGRRRSRRSRSRPSQEPAREPADPPVPPRRKLRSRGRPVDRPWVRESERQREKGRRRDGEGPDE